MTRRLVVRPIAHRTIETVSDHRAYLVTFRIWDHKGRSHTLTVGTMNLSYGAVKHKPAQLLRDLMRVAGECDILLMQEAGAARSIVDTAARRRGHQVWYGTGEPGQASTPVMVSKRLGEVAWSAHLLTRARNVGRGIGPDRTKPKWLMCGSFHFAGRRLQVANLHASLRVIDLLQVRRAVRAIQDGVTVDGERWSGGGIGILGGDLNELPGGRTLAPLILHGMRSSQRLLGILPTHGPRRALDDLYYELRRQES